jgi:predicted GNAT superfamily acetyltransferase
MAEVQANRTSALAEPAAASSADNIVVRQCRGFDELQACVDLQKEVWNFADADLIPIRMFVVAQKIGGQVIGSFDRNRLVGFAVSIPGNRAGHSYLHSHMLAVRNEYRNSGLGRRMKLAQRDEALQRGIELIEWTFDPMEIKNAYLNLVKLGAISRRYNINQYGVSSSPLQGGLPTDRLVAEWWLRSRRVVGLLEQGRAPQFTTEMTIDVPAAAHEWKANPATRGKALEVHQRNREKFLDAFSRGLAALGYERDAEGNGRFLIGRWDERWSYASE